MLVGASITLVGASFATPFENGEPMTSSEWRSHAAQTDSTCLHGPCYPGNEFCGQPFENAPKYHLMDQHGCGENDPNRPVFDPVHGVIHHFYQIREHDCQLEPVTQPHPTLLAQPYIHC